jgi:hypothetical protein
MQGGKYENLTEYPGDGPGTFDQCSGCPGPDVHHHQEGHDPRRACEHHGAGRDRTHTIDEHDGDGHSHEALDQGADRRGAEGTHQDGILQGTGEWYLDARDRVRHAGVSAGQQDAGDRPAHRRRTEQTQDELNSPWDAYIKPKSHIKRRPIRGGVSLMRTHHDYILGDASVAELADAQDLGLCTD